MGETLKCDRCGETYPLCEYNNFTDIEMRVWGIGVPYDCEFRLCSSCMAKANDWLKGEKVSKKVSDILPKTEILAQLAEEASELAQAALKLRRALDGTNPTPKSVEECLENIQEEMADVFVCLTMFGKSAERDGILIYNRYMEKVIKIEDEKEARWLHRLQDKEQSDE